MSHKYPAYEAHRSEQYPLSWLPTAAKEKLKTAFDQNGPAFAEILGIGHMAIAERSQVADLQYSPTMGFIGVLERRGYTIQDVQQALENIGVAADVIPAHIEAIVAFGRLQQARSTTPASMNGTHNNNRERYDSTSNQHFINDLDDVSIDSSECLSMNSAESGPSAVNGPQIVTNGYANVQCHCESCRIQSDPDETVVLVPFSKPKMPCTMNSMQQNQRNSIQQNQSTCSTKTTDPVSAPSHTVDGADSNGTMANTAHPAPCSKCQRQGMVIYKNTSTPHYLGDNRQWCKYCRGFVSTRGRCCYENGNVTETAHGDQRSSWPGDKSHADAGIPVLNPSLSDSQLDISGFTGDTAASSRRTLKLASYHTTNNRTQNGVGEVANRDTPGSMAVNSGRSNERGGSTIQRSLSLYNVFVTYSWNGTDRNHLNEVLRLCDRLRGADITVRMDMDNEMFKGLSRNKVEWLDTMTGQASHIIACISPSYYEDTRQVNAVSPEMNQLNARYVFDKIRLEYYNNMSMNERVIPVIFQNSGATVNHVPHCMGSTLVYSYPVNVQLIIDHIQHP